MDAILATHRNPLHSPDTPRLVIVILALPKRSETCNERHSVALQLPHPAALYHNDCQHIGDQMLSLPYTYAPKLAQLAPSAPAQLIDAAQRLKEAGNAVLNAQVGLGWSRLLA